MPDIIYGIVDSIINGDIFIINVTESSPMNHFRYNRFEQIKIAKIESSELDLIGGERDKNKLESVLLGRGVRCAVQLRETSGKLVADVEVI